MPNHTYIRFNSISSESFFFSPQSTLCLHFPFFTKKKPLHAVIGQRKCEEQERFLMHHLNEKRICSSMCPCICVRVIERCVNPFIMLLKTVRLLLLCTLENSKQNPNIFGNEMREQCGKKGVIKIVYKLLNPM